MSHWDSAEMALKDERRTLRSGMLNLLLRERLLVRVVAIISLSQVCWHVFSPGAEINQNSVMAAGWTFFPLWWEENTDGEERGGGVTRLYSSTTFLLRFRGKDEMSQQLTKYGTTSLLVNSAAVWTGHTSISDEWPSHDQFLFSKTHLLHFSSSLNIKYAHLQ